MNSAMKYKRMGIIGAVSIIKRIAACNPPRRRNDDGEGAAQQVLLFHANYYNSSPYGAPP